MQPLDRPPPSSPSPSSPPPPNHQETLTAHLDAVEVSLLSQIRSRSSDFFRETTRFHSLKAVVASSCSAVHDLRRLVAEVRRRRVDEVMAVPAMAGRRDRLAEVMSLVDGLKRALSDFGSVERSHALRDHVAVVTGLERLSANVSASGLSSVPALSDLRSRAEGMADASVAAMSRDLVDGLREYSVTDVEANFKVLPNANVLKRAGR